VISICKWAFRKLAWSLVDHLLVRSQQLNDFPTRNRSLSLGSLPQ
ncbi:15047_t:CDS:2, partial [Funneliformis mosseae]